MTIPAPRSPGPDDKESKHLPEPGRDEPNEKRGTENQPRRYSQQDVQGMPPPDPDPDDPVSP